MLEQQLLERKHGANRLAADWETRPAYEQEIRTYEAQILQLSEDVSRSRQQEVREISRWNGRCKRRQR